MWTVWTNVTAVSASEANREQLDELSRALAAILRGKIAQRQLQYAPIADQVDVSVRTLRRMVNGKAPIGIYRLHQLAQALGTSAPALLAEALAMVESEPTTNGN